MIGCVGGIATIFTTGLWDFAFCRFLVGMAFDNCFMMMYILGKLGTFLNLGSAGLAGIRSYWPCQKYGYPKLSLITHEGYLRIPYLFWHIYYGKIPSPIEPDLSVHGHGFLFKRSSDCL